jgi:hypothetical protein
VHSSCAIALLSHQSEVLAKLLFFDGDDRSDCLGLIHTIRFVPFSSTTLTMSDLSLFDLSQFSAHLLAESATAHCDTCGEVIDGYDRCGCDY